VLGPPVPKSVRFAEAPGQARSILEHAPRSAGAEAYHTIARILQQATAGGDSPGPAGS
jgi:chromosome partitioning protein